MLASAEVRRAERVALKCIAKSLSDARQSSGLTALWIFAAVGAEYRWKMKEASCGMIRKMA
jgi:hypothetical protein